MDQKINTEPGISDRIDFNDIYFYLKGHSSSQNVTKKVSTYSLQFKYKLLNESVRVYFKHKCNTPETLFVYDIQDMVDLMASSNSYPLQLILI